MIRIGLLGAKGRMGQRVTALIQDKFADRATLAVTCDRGDDMKRLLDTDVVIDFSLPEAMSELISLAAQADKPLPAFVIGSTGWNEAGRMAIAGLADHTPTILSSNFSTGMSALVMILKQAAPMLKRLGYTPVLVETHHKHKKDAPSGTALTMQRAIDPENPSSIQTHAIRAGEIIGDHEVTFYGQFDHLTLGHFAQDRSVLALGAIEVALWIQSKRAGWQNKSDRRLLTMEDFFNV